MPGEQDEAVENRKEKGNREKKIEANKKLQKQQKSLDKPKSSLPLQILLYFDWYFWVFYGVFTIILLIYKSYELPYPNHVFLLEFFFLLIFWAWLMMKIFLGSKGNKTETYITTVFFTIVNIPSLIAFGFFFYFQTYVLVIEVILNGIGAAFWLIEIPFGIIYACIFWNVEKRD